MTIIYPINGKNERLGNLFKTPKHLLLYKGVPAIVANHGKMFEDGLIFHTEEYVTENMKRCGLNIIRLPITNQIIRE
jgi:hypothetical protein